MGRTTAKGTPTNKPRRTNTPNSWYYETPRGVEVVAELRDKDGGCIGTTITKIPWWRLMGSAVRCGWKVQKIEPRAKP